MRMNAIYSQAFATLVALSGATANAGLPGAGYSTSNKAWGNPPKSWIVLGFSIAVIKVPLVSQWAEIQRIAVGFGKLAPVFCQPLANSFCSIAFIGLPWPIKSNGIVAVAEKGSVILERCFSSMSKK